MNAAAPAQKGTERERTVRFVEPVSGFESRATTRITSLTEQLEEAQGVIEKQKKAHR